MNTVITTQGPTRWDNLSSQAYGTDFDYVEIMKANPGIILSAIIPSGKQVIIPLVQSTAQAIDPNNLPPWKQ